MKNFDFEELQPLTNEEIREHASDCSGNPSIYLGTYAKYNNGSIYGQWIDLTSFADYDEFCDYCKRLHLDEYDPEKRCECERKHGTKCSACTARRCPLCNSIEFMVQDFECYPKCWYHESGLPTEEEFDRIQEYYNLDEDEQTAYEIYLDNFDEKADVDDFRDHYEGYYKSGADFAEYICEECGYLENLPELIKYCIDYNAVWRSLDTGGDYSEYDGHIFR